jgi:Ca-activated chloride channel homolog
MHVNAHLDVDLIAVEEADQVTVMLELLAPEAPTDGARAPAAVQVALDRSGSMAGPRLAAAQAALLALVDRLDPSDAFGLVAFANEAEVVVPSGALVDKCAVCAAIAAIGVGGSTNLSAGLLRGIQEARRSAVPGGATLLVVSDGMANSGVTDPARLEGVATAAQRSGVNISTVGIGLGYDETVLAAIARGGQGSHVFAEEPDTAIGALAGEVDGLLSKTVQAASLLVRPTSDAKSVTLFNDLPAQSVAGGVMVELGDLWAGEERKLLLRLSVPAIPALGTAQIAVLELRYVTLPELAEQTVTLPLSVNVVPGDQARGRTAHPRVRTELLFQQAQDAKRRAADAISGGDLAQAKEILSAAGDRLAGVDEHERQIVLSLRSQIDDGAARRAAKTARMQQARAARKRGRGA